MAAPPAGHVHITKPSSHTPHILSAQKARLTLGVSVSTLRRWRLSGTVHSIQPAGAAHHLYDVGPLLGRVTEDNATSTSSGPAVEAARVGLVYARVSSAKQKGDLVRQRDLLRASYPGYTAYSDVASGINFKRPGFTALLRRVHQGGVAEVVAATRDRVCRFAFDLVQLYFDLHNTKLTILVQPDQAGEHPTAEQQQRELAEDILAINSVFIARLQGRRAASYRRERAQRSRDEAKEAVQGLQQAEEALGQEGGESDPDTTGTGLSELCPESLAAAMAGLC